jgi:hydrogenase-4 component E
MHTAADLLLILVALSEFVILGTSRLNAGIRTVAWQGVMLGVLPLVLLDARSPHVTFLAAGTIALKGVVIPRLLSWAMREAAVRREVEPRVGYAASLLLGVLALGLAFAVAARLPATVQGGLLIPVALFSVMIGLVALITRTKAVSQVIGYLLLESGVYLFGLTQAARVPFLVEAGVLLDVFVGVFIMGIVVFHINREFDSISVERLTELREQ